MSQILPDLKYTETHEWVRIDNDIATIGITDYAQSELGDVVYVSLPEPGRVLAVDDIFGAVESVKTASDLYAPVPGEVTEVNGSLSTQPELVNSAPYTDGWLVKVRLSSPGAADGLMSAEAYKAAAG